YPKINFTYKYINEHRDARSQMLSGYLKLGNNKCKVDNVQLTNVEDRDKPVSFSYTFDLPDYTVSYDDEVYINLHMYKLYNGEWIDTASRKLDYEREFKSELKEVIVFEIPEGYTLKSVPANKSYRYDKAGFEFIYEV